MNKLEIEVLSMSGKSIMTVNGTNTMKPRKDASGLSQGMYILKVKTDNNVSIEKMLKK